MKNKSILILVQAVLSLISGILISKMSFLGKVGITLVYREYSILKTWWKVALLFFVTQLIIILTLSVLKKLTSGKFVSYVAIILFLIGIVGIYFTYLDFTETTHKILNTRFHSGFYLFWLGLFVTCSYFINFKPLKVNEEKKDF